MKINKEDIYIISEGDNFEPRAFLVLTDIEDTIVGARTVEAHKICKSSKTPYVELISYAKSEFEQIKKDKYNEITDYDFFYKEHLKQLKKYYEDTRYKFDNSFNLKYQNVMELIDKITIVINNTSNNLFNKPNLSKKEKENKIKSVKELNKRLRKLKGIKNNLKQSEKYFLKDVIFAQDALKEFEDFIDYLKRNDIFETPLNIFIKHFNKK